MPNTNFFGFQFPDENEDPHYEKLASFFAQLDQGLFSSVVVGAGSNIIMNQGTVDFNMISLTVGRLTWTEDFEIPIMGSGFYCKGKYGPDGVNRQIDLVAGDRVVMDVPLSSIGDINVNLRKINGKVPAQLGLYTVGFMRGQQFFSNVAGLGVVTSDMIGPLTIVDNTVSATPLVSFNAAANPNMIIEYSLSRSTLIRTGRIVVATNGATVSIHDDFVETSPTGVVFSADISGSDVRILYTASSMGINASFSYRVRS